MISLGTNSNQSQSNSGSKRGKFSSEKTGSLLGFPDPQSNLQKKCEKIIKSRAYEWLMALVSVAYLVNIIICAFFEDKYHYPTLDIAIG